jgi:hypothetical protein
VLGTGSFPSVGHGDRRSLYHPKCEALRLHLLEHKKSHAFCPQGVFTGQCKGQNVLVLKQAPSYEDAFLTAAKYRCKWLPSGFDIFTPWKTDPGTNMIVSWVDQRTEAVWTYVSSSCLCWKRNARPSVRSLLTAT